MRPGAFHDENLIPIAALHSIHAAPFIPIVRTIPNNRIIYRRKEATNFVTFVLESSLSMLAMIWTILAFAIINEATVISVCRCHFLTRARYSFNTIYGQSSLAPVVLPFTSDIRKVDNAVENTMIGMIRVYKNSISPMLPPNCRFVPTCSSYGLEAIEKFGPWKGGLLTTWRILRCNPTGGAGYDPPIWPPPNYFAGSNIGSE